MRDPVKDLGRVRHMLEMSRMLGLEKQKYSLESIRKDAVAFYGLTKMVEIIGEAAYMITKEFKQAHPHLPWREMEGMRHVLVHGYYTIRPEVLWDVVENDIPSLIPILENMLHPSE